jgi:hypothetical protein
MGRPCSVCSHPHRDEIDRALLGGAANRRVAARYGLSKDAVRRHTEAHLSPALAQAAAVERAERGRSLAGYVAELDAEARRLAELLERNGDARGAVAALRERIRLLGVIAQAAVERPGEFDPTKRPEWILIRGLLVEDTCPACSRRLAAKLRAIEDGRLGRSSEGV